MTAQITIRDYENLSAYLDGQLSNKEKASIEARMRTNPDLRRAFEEMNRTRMLLRSAPRHKAPRNFTLTPAMVGVQKRKPGGLFGYFPVLSFTSAVAALALILTFIFSSGPAPLSTANAPIANQAAPEAAQQMKAASESSDTSGAVMPQGAAPSIEMSPRPEATLQVEQSSGEQVPGGVVTWGFPPNSFSSAGKLPVGGGAQGLGGGGGGGGMRDYGGMGVPSANGQVVVPYDSAQSLPQSQPAASAAQTNDYLSVPTVEGTGPILGVPAEGQGGQYLSPLPTPVPTLSQNTEREDTMAFQPAPETIAGENEAPSPAGLIGLSLLTVIQILLGLLAVITGILAWWVWKRNR